MWPRVRGFRLPLIRILNGLHDFNPGMAFPITGSPDVPIPRFLQPSACPGHPGSLRRHGCFSLSKSFLAARLGGFSFTQLPNYPFTKSTKIYLLVNTLTPPLPPPHSSQSIPVWRSFQPRQTAGMAPCPEPTPRSHFFTTWLLER